MLSSSLPAVSWSRWTPLAAYLALLQPGFAVPLVLPRARWALTPPFHPYHPKMAVFSLWHFPSRTALAVRAQVLPGSLSTGARTFLE